jgi:hypothetical protein
MPAILIRSFATVAQMQQLPNGKGLLGFGIETALGIRSGGLLHKQRKLPDFGKISKKPAFLEAYNAFYTTGNQ